MTVFLFQATFGDYEEAVVPFWLQPEIGANACCCFANLRARANGSSALFELCPSLLGNVLVF